MSDQDALERLRTIFSQELTSDREQAPEPLAETWSQIVTAWKAGPKKLKGETAEQYERRLQPWRIALAEAIEHLCRASWGGQPIASLLLEDSDLPEGELGKAILWLLLERLGRWRRSEIVSAESLAKVIDLLDKRPKFAEDHDMVRWLLELAPDSPLVRLGAETLLTRLYAERVRGNKSWNETLDRLCESKDDQGWSGVLEGWREVRQRHQSRSGWSLLSSEGRADLLREQPFVPSESLLGQYLVLTRAAVEGRDEHPPSSWGKNLADYLARTRPTPFACLSVLFMVGDISQSGVDMLLEALAQRSAAAGSVGKVRDWLKIAASQAIQLGRWSTSALDTGLLDRLLRNEACAECVDAATRLCLARGSNDDVLSLFRYARRLIKSATLESPGPLRGLVRRLAEEGFWAPLEKWMGTPPVSFDTSTRQFVEELASLSLISTTQGGSLSRGPIIAVLGLEAVEVASSADDVVWAIRLAIRLEDSVPRVPADILEDTIRLARSRLDKAARTWPEVLNELIEQSEGSSLGRRYAREVIWRGFKTVEARDLQDQGRSSLQRASDFIGACVADMGCEPFEFFVDTLRGLSPSDGKQAFVDSFLWHCTVHGLVLPEWALSRISDDDLRLLVIRYAALVDAVEKATLDNQAQLEGETLAFLQSFGAVWRQCLQQAVTATRGNTRISELLSLVSERVEAELARLEPVNDDWADTIQRAIVIVEQSSSDAGMDSAGLADPQAVDHVRLAELVYRLDKTSREERTSGITVRGESELAIKLVDAAAKNGHATALAEALARSGKLVKLDPVLRSRVEWGRARQLWAMGSATGDSGIEGISGLPEVALWIAAHQDSPAPSASVCADQLAAGLAHIGELRRGLAQSAEALRHWKPDWVAVIGRDLGGLLQQVDTIVSGCLLVRAALSRHGLSPVETPGASVTEVDVSRHELEDPSANSSEWYASYGGLMVSTDAHAGEVLEKALLTPFASSPTTREETA